MTQFLSIICPSLIGSLFEEFSFVQFATQQQQSDSAPVLWILGIAVIIFAIGLFIWVKYSNNFIGVSEKLAAIMEKWFPKVSEDDLLNDKSLDQAIKTAGYAYDAAQDIFYSRIDAWQRNMGYCRMYDEASATFGMIIDCEPIYFDYDGKKWMIEFWKGQYDLTTGCEIGIYVAENSNLDQLNHLIGTFYNCVTDSDLLQMQCALIKNQKTIFTRKGKHWWLTGFKVGEYSQPSELTMKIDIILKTKAMREAFVQGMLAAGYLEKEMKVVGNRVSFTFEKPKTQQPMTRTKTTDEITQRKNQLLCESYMSITGPYKTFPEKMNAIKTQAPGLYKRVLNLGKGQQFLQVYQKIKEELKG